jgi:septal ring factor EnvC (AmiA/AmiB activator)
MKLSHIVHWLLLSSLLAILASCSNMSSVRNGKYISAKSEKKQQIKNVDENSNTNTNEIETVVETETYLPDEEKPAEAESNVSVKKIPTLQEQLERLNNRQDNFDSRIYKLEEQNDDINSKLDNLAKLITKNKNDVATTGDVKPKKKKGSFVLYPDEVVEKKKNTKPKVRPKSKDKTIIEKYATTPYVVEAKKMLQRL